MTTNVKAMSSQSHNDRQDWGPQAERKANRRRDTAAKFIWKIERQAQTDRLQRLLRWWSLSHTGLNCSVAKRRGNTAQTYNFLFSNQSKTACNLSRLPSWVHFLGKWTEKNLPTTNYIMKTTRTNKMLWINENMIFMYKNVKYLLSWESKWWKTKTSLISERIASSLRNQLILLTEL